MVGNAATRASRLLARAMAAKEVAAKNLVPSSPVLNRAPTEPALAAVAEEAEEPAAGNGASPALGELTRQTSAAMVIQRRYRQSHPSQKIEEDDAEDGDGDGDGDGGGDGGDD